MCIRPKEKGLGGSAVLLSMIGRENKLEGIDWEKAVPGTSRVEAKNVGNSFLTWIWVL